MPIVLDKDSKLTYYYYCIQFLDPEGGSQNATLVVLVVVGISSLKIP